MFKLDTSIEPAIQRRSLNEYQPPPQLFQDCYQSILKRARVKYAIKDNTIPFEPEAVDSILVVYVKTLLSMMAIVQTDVLPKTFDGPMSFKKLGCLRLNRLLDVDRRKGYGVYKTSNCPLSKDLYRSIAPAIRIRLQ